MLEEEQLGLKIPKDTVISVQEIDELIPSGGDRDAAAKQKVRILGTHDSGW